MKIIVVGSSIVDLVVRPTAPVLADNSNEADIRPGAGGAARNVAEVLARLGAEVTLVTDLGDDLFGLYLQRALTELGVDVRAVRSAKTGLYLAILRPDGTLGEGYCQTSTEQVPLAAFEPHLADLATFDGAVLDANLSTEVLDALAARCRAANVPYAIQTVASERAKKILGALPGATLVKPNRIEAHALTGWPIDDAEDAKRAAEHLHALGAAHVIVSRGPDGATYAGSAGTFERAPEPCTIVDVTGAGDSLLGAAFLGLLRGMPIDRVFGAAMRAAALACESRDAVSSKLDATIYREA